MQIYQNLIVCGSNDFHPYECNGFDRLKPCIHCIRQTTDDHIPKMCWLCCDGEPSHKQEDNEPNN